MLRLIAVAVAGQTVARHATLCAYQQRTATGGEALAYILKHHGRATIVGETTMGAAHSVRTHDLVDSFRMFVPDSRPVHPITGTNWEGRGVDPEIKTDADAALTIAKEKIAELRP